MVNKGRVGKLAELALGQSLEDYLYDRAARKWTREMIVKDINKAIKKIKYRAIVKLGILQIRTTNVGRWYEELGIISQAKRGPKIKGGKNDK